MKSRPFDALSRLPGMRLAAHYLIRGAAAANCSTVAPERVEQREPVGSAQRRRFVSVCQQTFGGCHSFREVRCLNLDASHRRMQAT